MAEKAARIPLGNPLDVQTQLGPLMTAQRLTDILAQIETAKNEGVKVFCGGEKEARPDLRKGNFIRPTIGHDTVEKPPFFMGPGGPSVIHIGYLPATVEEVFFPHAEVIGDVTGTLAQLADRLEGKLQNASALLPLREQILAHITDRAAESRFPLTPQRIVHDVRRVMPDDGIVCLDNGMYKIWFARNYRTRVANTLLLDNALATMGAGLPSAIVAAMLFPKRRVLAVCGDGGFMMNSQEMETAVRLGLNLVVLIIQDNAYGMIRWKQAADGFADWGLSFGNPDFVKYAESYGAKGARVETAYGLAPALESAFKAGGVHLVSVPVDYSENQRVLIEELGRLARS